MPYEKEEKQVTPQMPACGPREWSGMKMAMLAVLGQLAALVVFGPLLPPVARLALAPLVPTAAFAAVGTPALVSGTGYSMAAGQGMTEVATGTVALGTTSYTTNGLALTKATLATAFKCKTVDAVSLASRSSAGYPVYYDNSAGKVKIFKDVITVTTGATLTVTGVTGTIDMASGTATIDVPSTTATIAFLEDPTQATGTPISSTIDIDSATGVTVDMASASATITMTGVAATVSMTDSPFTAAPTEIANGASANWGTIFVTALCR